MASRCHDNPSPVFSSLAFTSDLLSVKGKYTKIKYTVCSIVKIHLVGSTAHLINQTPLKNKNKKKKNTA